MAWTHRACGGRAKVAYRHPLDGERRPPISRWWCVNPYCVDAGEMHHYHPEDDPSGDCVWRESTWDPDGTWWP